MGLIDKRSTSGFLLPTLWFAAHGFAIEDFQEVYYLGFPHQSLYRPFKWEG